MEFLISFLSLFVGLLSFIVASYAWLLTVKRTRKRNQWVNILVHPYKAKSKSYPVFTHAFGKERHYHVESIRIMIHDIDESEVPGFMFRLEDQDGWLTNNFGFDDTISHDVQLSYDKTSKTAILSSPIGSDGYKVLKLFAFNRTKAGKMIRIEPLVVTRLTVGDQIIHTLTRKRRLSFDKSQLLGNWIRNKLVVKSRRLLKIMSRT